MDGILKSLSSWSSWSSNGSLHETEKSEKKLRIRKKLKPDDKLIKMCRKHPEFPRESSYGEIITLMNIASMDSCWGLLFIIPKNLVIIAWKCDPMKARLLCCLIEFTENACLQNEISSLFTMQPGSLDRMGRGPFLLIKDGGRWGTRAPGGKRDCEQSSSTVAKKSTCLLLHCQVVIKGHLRKLLE